VTAGSGEGDGSGGVTGLVFVLFLGLGVLALLGGAILGGLFEGGPSGAASPTPTAAVATPTPEPTPQPSVVATETPGPASATPVPSTAPPTSFPDGFIARAEPCAEQPTASTCDNSGAVNDGEVWILTSFRHGVPTDIIMVEVLHESGTVVDDGSISLSFCGTNTDCAGYTYFRFSNLDPGDYDVRVTRNGTPAAETSFTVE
jgi:hypothetical protein